MDVIHSSNKSSRRIKIKDIVPDFKDENMNYSSILLTFVETVKGDLLMVQR